MEFRYKKRKFRRRFKYDINMREVFIIYENRRYSNYGIGTYISELSECYINMENILLNIVELYSNDQEFSVVKYEFYRKYNIPSSCVYSADADLYYNRAFTVLSTYINKNNQLIFHLNLHKYLIFGSIKNIFPYAKLICTIHFHEILVEFKGNRLALEKAIKYNKEINNLFIKQNELLKNVDHFICLTQYAYNFIRKHLSIKNDRLSLIYNGLKDEYIYVSKKDKNSIKQDFHLNIEDKIIIYTGRLDEIKGVDFLIRSFKKVIDIYPNCTLLIIGDGDFNKYLKLSEKYWSKIIFTGRLDKYNLSKIYQISNLGIIPSFYEQCSYSIIEMMMYNIPIIGTNCIGLNEMITDDNSKIKLIYSNNDTLLSIDELSNLIIKKLFSNKKCYNREIYLNRYSFDKMYSKIKEIYNKPNLL